MTRTSPHPPEAVLNVLVVEDDPILLDFLVDEVSRLPLAVERRIDGVASLSDARQFLGNNTPHWILLDLLLPDGNGLDLLPSLLATSPPIRILILTAQAAHHTLPATLLPHVYALLDKSAGLGPLRQALWSLGRGPGADLPDLSLLSPRQRQFLAMLGEGLDTSAIAERLGISFATAQTHRREITRRLGLKGSRLITLARHLASGGVD